MKKVYPISNRLFRNTRCFNALVVQEKEALIALVPEIITVCVTGDYKVEHKDLKKLIEEKGLVYSQVLSKKCHLLISSTPINEKSQKVKLARQYGVPIKDPAHLEELLGLGKDVI